MIVDGEEVCRGAAWAERVSLVGSEEGVEVGNFFGHGAQVVDDEGGLGEVAVYAGDLFKCEGQLEIRCNSHRDSPC